jgi:DNA-directed RNA polymerase specialized sigma24 family protein
MSCRRDRLSPSPPPMEESSSELLARLRPVLEEIFSAYGVSEAEARQILEETCGLLISKRWDRQNPGRWLLRTVIERCRELSMRIADDVQG